MLIFISISSLMIVFIQAGTVWSWISAPVISLVAVFLIGVIMFVLQERRADEPIMPLQIWQDPLIVVSNLATLRGVATASNMFMNILGSTMGAALLGGVLNIKLTNYLRGLSGDTLNVNVINVLLDPIKRGALPNDILNMMTLALATSLNFVFWGLLVVAALSLSLVLFFPNKDKVTT